jgi:hypothetical protein
VEIGVGDYLLLISDKTELGALRAGLKIHFCCNSKILAAKPSSKLTDAQRHRFASLQVFRPKFWNFATKAIY